MIKQRGRTVVATSGRACISYNPMDYKQFRKHLSETKGRSAADIDAMTEGLSVVIRQTCSELDSIAVPTFGTFVAVKHNEEVRQDLSTGKRMLLPPEINIEFHPGAMLLKKLKGPDEII